MMQGVLHAVLVFGYIIGVATLINNAKLLFGHIPEPSVFGPIAFLLLFVISAAVMALLVFGKPVMLYLDGKKKEGIALVAHTLGALVCIAILFFLALIIF